MSIIKILDAHIALAKDLDIKIDHIMMSQDDRDRLTDEILTAAGMKAGSIEFDGVKAYMGVRIATHSAPSLKISYSR